MITLSPSQDTACDAFREFLRDYKQKEFLLSGFAGSGKSFLVNYLIQLVADEFILLRLVQPNARPITFHFTATTNKAASVLETIIQRPTRTIHSALGLAVHNDFKTGSVRLITKNDCINLNNSVLVIDEASMINQDLLQHIRNAVREYKNCKVLFIGDSYQLPPIKENTCAVFLNPKNANFLTEIQRQAVDSPIISFSQHYRKILDNPKQQWPKLINNGTAITHYSDQEIWKKTILAAFLQDHEPDDVRILAWTNHRVRGYNNWLRKQQGYTEPVVPGEILLSNDTIIFSNRVRANTDSLHTVTEVEPNTVFDIPGHELCLRAHKGQDFLKVFQPSNWKATQNLLRVTATAAKNERDVDLRRDLWRKFFEIKNEWGDFRPIHAQTVHKSQGSTYKKVFIDVSDIAKNNKWHEVARLMYVAVTRASHEIHLFGNLEERYIKNDPLAIMEVFRDAKNQPTQT